MRLIIGRLQVVFGVIVVFAGLTTACGGCGSQPDVCRSIEFASTEGQPLDEIALQIEVEEGVDVGQLVAEVTAKGLDDPYYAGIDHDPESGSYTLVVPPHPDGIEGGKVKIRIVSEDGECNKNRRFDILPLPEAPGTIEASVEKTRQIVELQAEKLGVTIDDLETADDLAALPAPLWGPALTLGGLDASDNPNSILAMARGESEVAIDADGLVFANALVAKAGLLDALDGVISDLEALEDPEDPLEFGLISDEPGSPQALTTRRFALCPGILVPKFTGASALSYYMKLAHAASNALNEGAASKLDHLGSAISLIPHGAAKGAAIVIATIAHHQRVTLLAYANTLPSTIVNPEVDLSKTWFEEDSEESGTWEDTYKVSAMSNGWNATGAVLESLVQAVSNAIGAKGIADEVATAVRSGSLVGDLASVAATNGAKELLGGLEGGCTVRPWTWSNINVSATNWSEVDYALAIKAQSGNRWGYEPAKVGRGTVRLNISPTAFPPATNKLASLLVEEVEVREIIVTVDPGIERIEPGGSLDVRAIVRNAVDTRVEWSVIRPESAVITPGDDGADGHPTATITAPSDPDEFPIVIKAKSISRTGLRSSGQPERADFGHYNAEVEVIVSPPLLCVEKGKTGEFTAVVLGSDDKSLTWTAEGGSISGSSLEATYSGRTDGIHTVRATHEELGESGKAVAVVNECKCYYDVLVQGPMFAQFAHHLGIQAVTNGNSLTMTMNHPDGHLGQIISLESSGHGVNPGVPGSYRSAAAVTLDGAQSLAESFITIEGEPEDYGLLTIDTWEDDYITGRFSGRALLFGTVVQGLDEAVWVTITMRFETFVHEATDIFGAVTANCGAD